MRSLWSGLLTFGLINIPVKLHAAAREHTLNFDYLRKKDLCRVRYARVCEGTNEEVPYRDVVRGYEYQKGDYVVLSDEDFKRANVRKTRTIEIVDFVDRQEVDLKLVEKPFYLEPGKDGKRLYALLREALKRSGKIGIARFVLRAREHIGLVSAEEDVIVLDRMRFAGEIIKPGTLDLPAAAEVTEREVELALKLIEQLSSPFRPEEYRDTYTDELKWLIENKAHGKVPRAAKGEEARPTKIPDLLARLRESLEHAEVQRR